MRGTSRTRFLIVILLAMVLSACAALETVPEAEQGEYGLDRVPALALVPGTSAAMQTPGYWIGLHPAPDRLVMTSSEIAAFNARYQKTDSTIVDIADYDPTVSGWQLKAIISSCFYTVKVDGYYLAGGKKPGQAWWISLKNNMNLEAIAPRVKVRFGLISSFCDHRALPVAQGLYRKDLNQSFDHLQDNTLDIATPVAVLHQSRDGQWLYVAAATTQGWVRTENVALCEYEVFKEYVGARKFVVVTAAKADIFADEGLGSYLGRVQMGARLAVLEERDAAKIRILVPKRNKDGSCALQAAYIQTSEAHVGYLPYTSRTIINQAFKLLHTPYGWGGQFGEQDCSRFLQEVFATVGLVLPRHSDQQARIGRALYANTKKGAAGEKLAILSQQAIPGATVVHMNGHTMLFLGCVGENPYVIHALWGYHKDASVFVVVNRVAVTRLELGEGASGTFLDKTDAIRVLDALPATPTKKTLSAIFPLT